MSEFAAQTRRRNDQTFLREFYADSWKDAREYCGRHGLEKLALVIREWDDTPVVYEDDENKEDANGQR